MATSIISNTILNLAEAAAGSGAVVTAQLVPGSAFRTVDGAEVTSLITTTVSGGGTWSLTLERNSDIVPSGTYYVIREILPESLGGTKTYTIQVGSVNATLLASLVTPIPTPALVNYITQATGDARYQALGGLGASTPARDTATGTAGVSTSASREDHAHPGGTYGESRLTSDQAYTTGVTVYNQSVTATIPAGRRVRVSAKCQLQSSAGSSWLVDFTEDGVNIGRAFVGDFAGAASRVMMNGFEERVPAAGPHTYTLTATRFAGAGTLLFEGSGGGRVLLVEDIGT